LLYDPRNTKHSNRECYFIHNQTIENKRVLVVRTQYALVNRTGFPVAVKFSFKREVFEEVRLADGEFIPLRDYEDAEVNRGLEMSLQTTDEHQL